MVKKIRSNKWFWVLGIIVIGIIFIVIPFCTQKVINVDSNQQGTNDGWLGFWGGYLGSIIGVLGAILIVQIQIAEERENKKNENIDNTFFNLLSMYNQQKNMLIETKVFDEIYLDFSEKLKGQLKKEGVNYFYKNKDMIIKQLEILVRSYEKFMEDNEKKLSPELQINWTKIKEGIHFGSEDSSTKEFVLYEELCMSLEKTKELKKFLENVNDEILSDFYGADGSGVYGRLVSFVDIPRYINWNIPEELNVVKSKLAVYKSGDLKLLSKDGKKEGIEAAIEVYYGSIGAYFRIFHRIIKYINIKVKDEQVKKDYLGFLRAITNEKEMLVLFYNAVYTERGEGLLKEIKQTTFFGESEELLENNNAQHFNSDQLLWKSEDLNVMRNFGKGRS